MKKPRRIVCYAINGSGLGHLTRLISVGRWLRRYVTLLEDQPPEVLFLTSSDASDILAQAGFASFKIPSKTVSVRAGLDKLEYRRLAKHFVWQMLGVFSPDLFVVDTFPSGSFDELFQVLDGPFKKSFVFRGVKPEYAARPIFRSALGMYDAVVVPHQHQTSYVEQLAPTIQASFSGEVVQFERDELLPAEAARRELGVADGDRLVYLSAGGGGDPDAESTISGLVDALRHEPGLHLLVGAGPLYHGNRMAGPRLTWFDSPNIWRYFHGLDAAISAAGYNTFHELIYAGVPTAFYSQEKIADDQSQRIADAERVGACSRIEDITNPDEVRMQLNQVLDPSHASAMKTACAGVIPANGARRCAIELLRPLYKASSLDWARQVLTPTLVHSLERVGNGSTSVLSNWLSPLIPHRRIEAIVNHAGFEAVLRQLSDDAAREVEQVLANSGEAQDKETFEQLLIDLLRAVELRGRGIHDCSDFADEVLKTLLTAMKKQSGGDDNGGWLAFVSTNLAGIRRLISDDYPDMPVLDVLRLYRMLPRIVGADSAQTCELFDLFLRQKISKGEPTHEIMHQLQVLKMAHSAVTREILESHLEGAKA